MFKKFQLKNPVTIEAVQFDGNVPKDEKGEDVGPFHEAADGSKFVTAKNGTPLFIKAGQFFVKSPSEAVLTAEEFEENYTEVLVEVKAEDSIPQG
jgi:hypothetical protein